MRALNIHKLLGRAMTLTTCLWSVSFANAQMLDIKVKGQEESHIHHIFKGNEQRITRVEIGKLTDDMKHVVFEPASEDINWLTYPEFSKGIGTEEMVTLPDGSTGLHVTPKNTSVQIELGLNLPYMPDGTYEATLVMAPLCMLNPEDLRGGKFSVRIYNSNEEGEFSTKKQYYTDLTSPEGSGEGKNFLFESSTDEAVIPLGTVDLRSNFYETERVLKISTTVKSTERKTYAKEFIVKRIKFTRKDNDDADYVKTFGENGLRSAIPLNDIETINCYDDAYEATQLEARYKSINEGTELKMANVAFADFPDMQEMNANMSISYVEGDLPVSYLPPSRTITFVRTGEQEFTANVPLLSPSVYTGTNKEYEVTTDHEMFAGTFSLYTKDMVEPCTWTLVKNNIGDKGETLDFTRSLQLKAEVAALPLAQWESLKSPFIPTIMLIFDANGNFVHSCEGGSIKKDEEIHTLSTEFLMNDDLLTPSSEYTACVAFMVGSSYEISTIINQTTPVWFSEKFTFTTPSQEEYDKAKTYAQERYIASLLPNVMAEDKNISIYNEAIKATQINKLMEAHEDDTYTIDSDSIDWTNPRLCIHVDSEVDNVAYPEKRYFKFTAFAVPDAILAEKYGIKTLDDLRRKAHEIYAPLYPEDANVTDEKNPKNYLNRFVAYHILPFDGAYYKLTYMDGSKNQQMAKAFNRHKADICDYYETVMPHSLMKFSFPSGNEAGLYINRCGVQSRPDQYGRFERGAKVATDNDMKANLGEGLTSIGSNGRYFYIDDIITYGKRTQEYVLNERIRMDATTLSPDFMTSGARGFEYEEFTDGMYANSAGENYNPLTNKARCLGFKAGAAKNFIYNDNTHLHVRPRYFWIWSYEGDEIIIKGQFDLTVKLPPVPAGTYEVRMLTCTGFKSRGIVQPYIDGVPQGEPQDLRLSGHDIFGWKSDMEIAGEVAHDENNRELSEEELEKKKQEAIVAFDKEIHAKGWMKGPGNYIALGNTYSDINRSFRSQNNTIRWVLGTFTTDGKSNHYLRLQQVLDSGDNVLNLDFIELVPSTVYDNPQWPEDPY